MAAEAGGEGRAGIGTRLRAAREQKGLTILQAAEKMHVDARILEALEAEDFAALGAAVYARGHLRHYAELVGEQTAELLELYGNSKSPAPVQPDLTRISHVPPEGDSVKLSGSAVVVLVTIAAIGTLWWFMTSPEEKLQPTNLQQGQQQSSDVGGTASAGSTEPGRANPPPAEGPASAKVATGALPAVASQPSTSAGAAPARALSLSSTSTATSSSAAPPTTREKTGELTLKFSADSWVEVYDASGQRLFYDVGAASTAHTVRGSVPMRVVLGNAAGVALEFNGRPAPIPSGVRSDGSVRFIINAHGRAVSATDGG